MSAGQRTGTVMSGMRFAEIGGAAIRYRVAGDPRGPAVVFVHAPGTDLTLWDAVLERLPAGRAMVGYDLRGHGLSGLPAGGAGIGDHAGDLLGLADRLGLGALVLCGVSAGGAVALAAAAQAPKRVRGLVLCAPAAGSVLPDGAAEHLGAEALADAAMAAWFTPAFRAHHGAELAGCRAMLARTPEAGLAALRAAMREADLSALAAAVRAPTLCIAGAEDRAAPPDAVAALADLIAGAEHRTIAGCGHLAPVERPADCAALIAEFLDRLDAAAAEPARSAAYASGMEVRRRVLGAAHVERATAAAGALDRRFQTLITEGAWGTVWSGRHFTLRERSIVTLALLAALGQDEELAMHLRATANTGAGEADIAEALLHVAVYAGAPRANRALKIAREVLADRTEEE